MGVYMHYVTSGEKTGWLVKRGAKTDFYENFTDIPVQLRASMPVGEPDFIGREEAYILGISDILYPNKEKEHK